MFAQLSIHHPKPDATGMLIESMHAYGDALDGAPGLISVHTFQDKKAGVLVGLALWASEDLMKASVHLARAAVEDHPFDTWEERESEGYLLTDV
ncbi:MAG: hypothetical protein KF739_12490 [Cryobacterium sp.]|nr:hypothetical protein [Micrococcales bacterium]MBX3077861.1 hypothetical protein [Cryobacterium sp.]MBX3311231.1 hypothetical protein [Cryobacterium sp.]MCB1280372.1 hypothetical protein [Salinibacterium sp.]HNP15589.1 hypothetical protein [Terrimesophilobacter sp.]